MIASIRLQNFRSYKDESFEFEPGVNIIVGPNGSGKTNLLESILAVCTGSSYRAHDEDLIAFDQAWSRLDANTDNGQRTLKLELLNAKLQKSYIFNDKSYKILTFNNHLPVVVFEPNHLQLLHGQPDLRRTYLDTVLEQLLPGFSTTRKHYRRVLAQRNALLKSSKKPSKEQLFVWDLRLSELGGVIAKERSGLISDIADQIGALYREISGDSKTVVTIDYVSKLQTDIYESQLLHALELSYQKDIERGFTSFGPHRDDFVISFGGHPATETASRGETRTTLLALKIHELKLLELKREIKPIMLLDDVFSELDGKRRHALARFLQTHQTFITTTDADFAIDLSSQKQRTIALGR